MSAITKVNAPVAPVAPVAAAKPARIHEAQHASVALAADSVKLSTSAKAQAAAPAAAEETLKQKIVKRGMAGVCGLAGGAVAFIGIIAALEFGIGVPAAHRILGWAAPLVSTAAAWIAGWLGYKQGQKWVG